MLTRIAEVLSGSDTASIITSSSARVAGSVVDLRLDCPAPQMRQGEAVTLSSTWAVR